MRAGIAIVRLSMVEAFRRRVFAVVVLLTVVFLALYGWGVETVFDSIDEFDPGPESDVFGIEADVVVGATMLGLAMFATLFLAAVLAVFLTIGAVRADAERGLLQPVLVRPVPRWVFLCARFAGGACVAAGYAAAVFGAAIIITGAISGWWPDHAAGAVLALMAAIVIITGLSVLGSIGLSSTANGVTVLMLLGAGLTAGLLGQIGEALESDRLTTIATVASWALPFEALYQSGLAELTAETRGTTDFVISLGPFGGGQAGGLGLWLWCAVYLIGLGVIALRWFGRRDLG